MHLSRCNCACTWPLTRSLEPTTSRPYCLSFPVSGHLNSRRETTTKLTKRGSKSKCLSWALVLHRSTTLSRSLKMGSTWTLRRSKVQCQYKSFQTSTRLRSRRNWLLTNSSHTRKAFHHLRRCQVTKGVSWHVLMGMGTTEKTFSNLRRCTYTDPSSTCILETIENQLMISTSHGSSTWMATQRKPSRRKR